MTMSRHKFRIWDKTKNEWLGASDKNSVVFRNFDLCGQTLRMQQLPMDVEDKSKYVIEQFTDLLDDNGNSIYEGDLVKTDDNIVGLITYCQSLLSVEWDSVASGDLSDFSSEFRTIQIIGNIHENPELIPKTLRGLHDQKY